MYKISITFVLALVSWACVGQSSRTFDLKNFDALEMGSAFKIDVKQGSYYSIVAEGQQKDLDDLEARVSGGELQIRYKSTLKWNNNRKTVNFTITMPTIKGLDFSGASSSKVSGFGNLGDLNISISGASNANISFASAGNIKLDVSGATRTYIKGKGKNLKVDLSGASTLDTREMPVETATVDVSGASTAKVNVTEQLDAEASGASSVRYVGNPRVRKDTSGASSVKGE